MKNRQIKFGALLSYFSIALNIVAGLLYTPWMIEQIGESDYGLYTLANSLITLFLLDFGLSSATSRFVSKYVAEGKYEEANTFLGAVYKLYLLIDAVMCFLFAIIFVCIDRIYVSLSPLELQKFKVIYCIAAGYAIINFPFVTLNGVLTSYEKFIQLKLADILQRVMTIVMTVIALLNDRGLYALVFANAIAGLVTIMYKYIIVRKTTHIKANFRNKNKAIYQSIFSFSLWATIATLAQRLIFNITPTILGRVSNSAEIATFGVVATIEQYSYMFTTAINGMFMPKISRIYSEDPNGADLMPLMLKVGRFQFALNGLLVIGFAILGESFMILWMGESLSNVGGAYIGILLVLFPGLFFNSLEVANTAMLVQNRVKEQAYIAIVVGILNLLCSMILSSSFGAIGACISIFIAYIVRAILYHIVQYKVMHIDIILFAKECYLKMLSVFLIVGGVGIALNHFIVDMSWGVFFAKGILLITLYGVCVWQFGLTRDEKKTLFEKFTNR